MKTKQQTDHVALNVTTFREEIQTQGRDSSIDITPAVRQALSKAKISQGTVTVFVTGSTAGVTTIEYEPGLVEDLQAALRRLFPEHLRYAHHEEAGDDNGFSHLRAAFIGPSLTIPVVDGNLTLGTWQQIVIIDFDTHARRRPFIVQVMGV